MPTGFDHRLLIGLIFFRGVGFSYTSEVLKGLGYLVAVYCT